MRLRVFIQMIPLFCLATVFAQPGVSAPNGLEKRAALSWYDGAIKENLTNNCIIGNVEYGVGTYVGFNADPNAGKPSPNSTYYVHVVVSGVGNPCKCLG